MEVWELTLPPRAQLRLILEQGAPHGMMVATASVKAVKLDGFGINLAPELFFIAVRALRGV